MRVKLPPAVRRKRNRIIHPGTLFIIVGVAAIAAAAAIWLYNEYDNKRAEESSQVRVDTILDIIRTYDPESVLSDNSSAAAPSGGTQSAAGGADPTADISSSSGANVPGSDSQQAEAPIVGSSGGTSYVVVEREAYMGILTIPRFSLSLPVNLTWSYQKLRTSPCRYSGDIEHNDLVIAAHSYRSHFGNINSMEVGDPVTFTDIEGHVYTYYVAALEIAHPSDTRSVVTSVYDLTLFTCTFDSRSRVVVRCNRVDIPQEVEPSATPDETQTENDVPAAPQEPVEPPVGDSVPDAPQQPDEPPSP